MPLIRNPLSKGWFPSPLPLSRGRGEGVRARFLLLKTGFDIRGVAKSVGFAKA
jgi:hypothetical protein